MQSFAKALNTDPNPAGTKLRLRETFTFAQFDRCLRIFKHRRPSLPLLLQLLLLLLLLLPMPMMLPVAATAAVFY